MAPSHRKATCATELRCKHHEDQSRSGQDRHGPREKKRNGTNEENTAYTDLTGEKTWLKMEIGKIVTDI